MVSGYASCIARQSAIGGKAESRGLVKNYACAHIVHGSCGGFMMRESAAIRQNTPKLVSDLLDGLREPRTTYISPARFGELAGLSQGTIARLAGVHRNTVRVNPASEPLQDRLREMIKIITSAVELTGDVEKAFFWFRNEPIADYKRKTAADLVAEGHAGAVLTHLEDLRNGPAG